MDHGAATQWPLAVQHVSGQLCEFIHLSTLGLWKASPCRCWGTARGASTLVLWRLPWATISGHQCSGEPGVFR